MLRPRTVRNLAVYGASLPTLAAPTVVAGATIYLPSHLAARMLGDCQPVAVATAPDAPDEHPGAGTSHAA